MHLELIRLEVNAVLKQPDKSNEQQKSCLYDYVTTVQLIEKH